LKKIADDIFRDWQSRGLLDCTKDHKSVRSELDRIIDLPSGWRDDDYQHAINSLNTIVRELYSNNPYLLQNDIYAGRDSLHEPGKYSDEVQFIREQKNAVFQAKKLISLINSAIDLNSGKSSDNAAVIMELVRNTALSLLKEKRVPKSDASAVCLMMADQCHKKPDWLVDQLAELLKKQLNEKEIEQLKERL
jgi:hypothetical protein